MEKVNITIEIEKEQIINFENWLKNQGVNLLDLTIVPDTNEMYKNDITFRRLSGKVKEAKRERDIYYNEKRNIK